MIARRQYWTAVRYLLIEQARNRTALLLLAGFVPLWYGLMVLINPDDPVDFRFRITGAFLHVDGRHLTLLTAGLNAITLVVGFVLFSSTRRGLRFDHRLVLSGYLRPVLMLAKLTALAVVAIIVALYALAVLLLFWRPAAPMLVLAGFTGATLVYGAFGLLLGVLVQGELEGFFLVIMVSLMDTFLQNPIGNPVANKDALVFFPSFPATQVVVAGGFTNLYPGRYLLLTLAWTAGLALLGLAGLYRRTRVARGYHAGPYPGTRGASRTQSAETHRS
jgi:ABC-2 type transport system permease protein